MISYAQNLEDVVLMRALRDIDQGFYIDVGAAWPDEHSVTKAFYEKGWSGINIEPNPEFLARLIESRVRDMNIGLALGDKPGTQCMSLFEETGLSTLVQSIAENNILNGRIAVRQEVEVTTLDKIWEVHVPEGQDVHFLKIDVEGFEEAVLKGNDWLKNRPWIIVVEATTPGTQVESYENWENLLTNSNYHFVYADGLNRFYVSDEHLHLAAAFKYPPNVFDNFRLSTVVLLEQRVAAAELKVVKLECEIELLNQRTKNAEYKYLEAMESIKKEAIIIAGRESHFNETINAAREELARCECRVADLECEISEEFAERHRLVESRATDAEIELSRFRASLSWRITHPLRKFVDFSRVVVMFFRSIINASIFYLVDRFQWPISRLMRFVLSSPILSNTISRLILNYPPLYQQLQAVAVRQGIVSGKPLAISELAQSNKKENLSSRARQIYDDLCELKM